MTRWVGQDWLFAPSGGALDRSHAMLPTPVVMNDRIRVFYAACDADLRGRIFRVDIEREPPWRIIERPQEPVMNLGPPGAFDCDGVNPCQAVWREGKLRLHYIGWRRGPPDSPYTLFSGASDSPDHGLSFPNASVPMLTPSPAEPLFRTAAFIYPDGGRWAALYIGGDRFSSRGGKIQPIYSLRQTFSDDGLNWPTEGRVLLAPNRGADELGFGRPVVWREAERDILYLSIRTMFGYELAWGTLADALRGLRRLQPALDFPQPHWATQMTCFGYPCRVAGLELLFYNGNQFGRTGFGLAMRQVPPQRSQESAL